ncbi:invasion associated locus B family protein [Bradyrhizobium sp. Ash2021]|uniref:invasion associated locus B family protein n=1 Tax=Bradyrhizobium sp. Ash2021 TaxID=2954771 RepID=UPI002814F493|nr:invasion associated locus B family protein [Bradyrhizobium sp. Ash2021]WMT79699.1 invasion associated locus B family protein [Bradyrhizobium sp. Ash2021]
MGSRRASQFCPLSTSLFAALSLLLSPNLADAQQATPSASDQPQAEVAPRGQRSTVRQIKYGDWQKYCFKTPGTNQVCRTTISGNFDTGQTAVRADLIEREGEGKVRLQLFLPVGLYLQAGVKLTVDQGKPHQIPYVWCLTNTCIAANVADAALIREMEQGQNLQLDVVDSSVQSVSTTLSLGQFASVRHGAPARTFEQEIDE